MKKVLSVFLAAVLAFLSSLSVLGIDKEVPLTEYPVIMVAGYSSSTLVRTEADGTQKQVWYPDWDEVLRIVLSRIGQLGAGLAGSVVGKPQYLADVVGKELQGLLGDMRCNPDGTSTYDVSPMLKTAADSNVAAMFERYGSNIYQHEVDIMGLVGTYVDNARLFNFNCDWRMGAVECAAALDTYIQQVKEYCHADKVNLLAVSHGGQVSATYLTLYGYKKDVHNAVLTVPAIRGAGVISDALALNVHLDELQLLYFIENGMMWENDFHRLVESQPLGFLDEVFNRLLPYAFEVCGNWGSIWDFCPTETYEAMKAKWLDPTENAELIRKSDYMHYTVMPQFYTALQKCNDEYDMHVSIVAGTDIDLTTGGWLNSDGLILVPSSTGATVPAYGKRFADGYVQENACGGKYKVSPAMTVDASTAYLPDNTWFVSGLFHGMTYWDMYTRELMMRLTLTDTLTDVYADPDFPQFHESSNPSNAVWAKFDKSTEGYLSAEDTALLVKNISEEGYTLRLAGITCDGADIRFRMRGNRKIKAGETVAIPFTAELPQVGSARISLIFDYTICGSLTPVGQRVMSFTLQNGKAAPFNADEPEVSAFAKTPFDRSVFGKLTDLLTRLGLYPFCSTIYNFFYAFFHTVKA